MSDPKRSPEEPEQDGAPEQNEPDVPEDLDVDADDASQVMGGRPGGGAGVVPMVG